MRHFQALGPLSDVHIMSEFMSPNKLVFVAPEKIPRLSLRKGWPYLMAESPAL
jgi:hypothetical protein